MRFLLIPCSLFPLHSLVFSDVPRLRFQSSNLRTAQEVHSFALSKMSSCVSNPCQIFLRKKCVAVRILSISCSLLLLHCFGPSKILEVLNRCIVSHSLLWFRGHLSRGKDFYIKRTWMLDCCRYNVVFFHCSVSRLAMFHSRVFSPGILEILKRTLVSSFLKCSRGCLTRVKYY